MTASVRDEGLSLIVVGTGIRMIGQLTTEAIAWMRHADRLLYVAADRPAGDALQQLNPNGAESLATCYVAGRSRLMAYEAMVDRILTSVCAGHLTCVASYGHPGVFGAPFHEAVRRARAEGYAARMLPAISAEDCLFADLGIDPADHGCQSYDATDFLMHRRTLDPTAAAILWQVREVGDPLARIGTPDAWALPMLAERLAQFHPPDHICTAYRASLFPGRAPEVVAVTVRELATTPLPPLSTLYIPPSAAREPDPIVLGRMRAMVAGDGLSRRETDERPAAGRLTSGRRPGRQLRRSVPSLQPERSAMSVLAYPRIHFRGRCLINAPTANNDDVVVNLDETNIRLEPELEALKDDPDIRRFLMQGRIAISPINDKAHRYLRGGWNYLGDSTVRLPARRGLLGGRGRRPAAPARPGRRPGHQTRGRRKEAPDDQRRRSFRARHDADPRRRPSRRRRNRRARGYAQCPGLRPLDRLAERDDLSGGAELRRRPAPPGSDSRCCRRTISTSTARRSRRSSPPCMMPPGAARASRCSSASTSPSR